MENLARLVIGRCYRGTVDVSGARLIRWCTRWRERLSLDVTHHKLLANQRGRLIG
jgi:hypothetical protein